MNCKRWYKRKYCNYMERRGVSEKNLGAAKDAGSPSQNVGKLVNKSFDFIDICWIINLNMRFTNKNIFKLGK